MCVCVYTCVCIRVHICLGDKGVCGCGNTAFFYFLHVWSLYRCCYKKERKSTAASCEVSSQRLFSGARIEHVGPIFLSH